MSAEYPPHQGGDPVKGPKRHQVRNNPAQRPTLHVRERPSALSGVLLWTLRATNHYLRGIKTPEPVENSIAPQQLRYWSCNKARHTLAGTKRTKPTKWLSYFLIKLVITTRRAFKQRRPSDTSTQNSTVDLTKLPQYLIIVGGLQSPNSPLYQLSPSTPSRL